MRAVSPRSLALLEQAGLTPDLLNPTLVDELPRKNEAARTLAKRLARTKAEAALHARQVKDLGEARFVLAADTVVSCRAPHHPEAGKHRRGGGRA